MKITITGCEPLLLSEETIAPESGKFDSTTSYASKLVSRLGQKAYREKKLPMKLECLRLLQQRAVELGDYKSYYEPLAGVGLSARLLGFNRQCWLNDLDEGCANTLRANFPGAKVWQQDINKQAFPSADLIFMDFNDFTLKRYLGTDYFSLLNNAFRYARRFVVLNDCSNFYFRYGETSFEVYSKLLGEKLRSTEDYLKALSKTRMYTTVYDRWNLAHAAYFRESTFQLFYRGDRQPFKVDEVKVGLPVRLSVGGLLS